MRYLYVFGILNVTPFSDGSMFPNGHLGPSGEVADGDSFAFSFGPRSRRAIDIIDPAALAVMSPRMRQLALEQPEMDAKYDRFTPKMAMEYEEDPKLGILTPNERIGQSHFSAVFSVLEKDDVVVKMQANCAHRSRRAHPLLVDFWLASAAAESGASVIPSFISPAALMPWQWSRKTDFSHKSSTDCRVTGGLVRFMVMERVAHCLDELSKPPVPPGVGYVSPPEAIRIGIKLINALSRIHQTGVIHGDVIFGNVCFDRKDPSTMKLIDFGLGSFVDSESDEEINGRLSWVHAGFTPWQLEGKGYARRDDVYKAVFIVANLMLGGAMEEQLSALLEMDDTGEAFLAWKKKPLLFESPTFDPIAGLVGLGDEKQADIRQELELIQQMVLALDSVESEILYSEIETEFRIILSMMQSAGSTSAIAFSGDPDLI